MMMNPVIKSLAMNVLPPIVLRGLLAVGGRRSKWSGSYSDWASAVAASSGYDADTIFQIVRNAALAVRDGQALWERDSTCFYHEEYNWQLLACLMTVAARSGGALHVLDFGGALGSTYMQHRKILSGLLDCSWSVVEQPHIVACGKTDFATDKLEFFDTIDKCFSSRPVNVVLFSSVLQYLENPYNLLEEVVSRSPAAIIIDRTPMANKGERITVQHVPKIIYSASYPCRFLDANRVQSVLMRSRTLTPWFASPVDPPHFLGAMSLLKKEDK
jgi:putative methyltransferase (TIGR04325 family)